MMNASLIKEIQGAWAIVHAARHYNNPHLLEVARHGFGDFCREEGGTDCKVAGLPMASKRGLAIVPIIFFCSVLSMELSCAENSLPQPSEKDDVISCRMDLEHHFEKKQGFINATIHQPQFNMNESLGPDDCPRRCWESCSCIAYETINENGTGCIMYEGTLEITETSFLNHYIYVLNVSPSYDGSDGGIGKTIRQTGPLPNNPNRSAKKQFLMWLLGAAPPALAMCLVAVMCYSRTKKAKISHEGLELKGKELGKGKLFTSGSQIRPSYTGSPKLEKSKKLGCEMQIFSIRTIWTATNQFSSANKLGEGGFGPVYKGYLPDGKEIAVKRLSSCSSQGIAEFKNEIRLVAQLQHTNLVRLLGCCIGRGEKILVYEFLPHKSLDSFLFDPIKKKLLNWEKRFDIIEGIAQGLLYLHKYSRLKVIHRDLKTSNILLDSELNPKISDFGLARIFDKNKSEGNTNRVAGTYGYMSPEYAMEGLYSEKSDVFSFGVIILEIMSGKKTTSLSGTDRSLNLIGHAWDLWREGKSLELIDHTIGETCGREELLRYIHVGLLCVEVSVAERPTMSDVIYMLTNSTIVLPVPKQPAFYNWRSNNDVVLHQREVRDISLNFVSLSPVQGR